MKDILAIILSFICSCGINLAYLSLKSKRSIHVRFLLLNGLSALCSVIIVYIIAILAFPNWTVYEKLFMSVGIGLIILTIANGVITKEGINGIKGVLLLFCMESILVATYSILTYGQTVINSDTATATLLSHSQFNNRSLFPESWWYVNGSIWTIGISTFVAPFTFLLRNQTLARMLGSALFVIVTAGGIIYATRKIFKNDFWIIAIPLFLLFLNGQSEHVLYQGSYTGNMLWGVVIPAITYAMCYHSNKKCGISYAIITFILAIGGLGVFSGYIIPLAGAIIILWFLENKETEHFKWKSFLKNIAILIMPAVLGYVVYIILRGKLQINYVINNMSGNKSEGILFASSLDECWDNLKTYFSNYIACFGYLGSKSMISVPSIQNLISISFCLLICGIIPYLQWKKIKEESREVRFFFFYSIIHILIVFFMTVFFSLTIERYVLSSIFLQIIISSRYIYAYWLKEKTIIGYVLNSCLIICLIFQCVMLTGQSIDWTEKVYHQKAFNQQLIDKGLSKGYATYWHAYNNEIYSDLNIQYGAIDIDNGKIYEYDWLVDSNTYKPQKQNTFLILEPFEEELIGFDIQERFGQIQEKFIQDGLTIYIFDHDIATNFYHKGIYEASELFTMNDVTIEDNKYIIHPNGVVFGPFERMDEGNYIITFQGVNIGNADCDVFSNSMNNAIISNMIDKQKDSVIFSVNILDKVDDIEYRTYNNSFEDVIFYKVIIKSNRQQ